MCNKNIWLKNKTKNTNKKKELTRGRLWNTVYKCIDKLISVSIQRSGGQARSHDQYS